MKPTRRDFFVLLLGAAGARSGLAAPARRIGGSVSMVDVSRHQVVRTIPIPRSKPVGVVVSPVATIPAGAGAWGVAISP